MTTGRKSEEHKKNREETYKSMNIHKNITEKQTKREVRCV